MISNIIALAVLPLLIWIGIDCVRDPYWWAKDTENRWWWKILRRRAPSVARLFASEWITRIGGLIMVVMFGGLWVVALVQLVS